MQQSMKVPDAWRRTSLEDAKLQKLSDGELSKAAQKLVERASEVAIAAALGDREAMTVRGCELLKTLTVVLARHGVDINDVINAAATRDQGIQNPS